MPGSVRAVQPNILTKLKRVVIIANPISGMGRTVRAVPRLRRALKALGIRARLRVTRRAGDGQLLAAALADGCDAVIAVGGDGTINEVVNGIAGRGIPFATFPTGTSNVLAKEFGLPSNVRAFAEMLANAKVTWIDTARVGQRRFALFAGIGLDARVTRILSRVRKSTISLFHYVLPTLKVIREFDPPKLTVSVDGKVFADDASYCLVSNVRSYGGPFEIAWRADPTDGLLDVCVTLGRRRRDMLRYFWASVVRQLKDHGDVLYTRGRRISVTAAREAPYQVDGDFAGVLPMTINVQPRSLPLLGPAAAPGERPE